MKDELKELPAQLTLYREPSPFGEEAVTKGSGLTGKEIDGNMILLFGKAKNLEKIISELEERVNSLKEAIASVENDAILDITGENSQIKIDIIAKNPEDPTSVKTAKVSFADDALFIADENNENSK